MKENHRQANFRAGRFRGNIGALRPSPRNESVFYVGVSPIREPRNDNRFLPSANLLFDAGDTVVLRASAAKVMARHRYSALSGSTSLDDRTSSGSGGNPNLKPYLATNFGLSANGISRRRASWRAKCSTVTSRTI